MTTTQRLLLVEDEPTLRELLSARLQLAGFHVVPAETGAQALTAVRERHPDLIVLDVMLPDIDGFEVARRLREQPTHGLAHPPILFLTARDAAEDRISGLRAGGYDYVTKPFNLEELVLRIQAVLRRTSGRRARHPSWATRHACAKSRPTSSETPSRTPRPAPPSASAWVHRTARRCSN